MPNPAVCLFDCLQLSRPCLYKIRRAGKELSLRFPLCALESSGGPQPLPSFFSYPLPPEVKAPPWNFLELSPTASPTANCFPCPVLPLGTFSKTLRPSGANIVRVPRGTSASSKTDRNRPAEVRSNTVANAIGQLPGTVPMKMCAVALFLSLLAAAVWLGLTMTTPESSGGGGKPGGGGGGNGCVPTPLPEADVGLCGNLEVFYMELGNISCKVIPKCDLYRQKITTWPQPIVKFPAAMDGAQYLLVMVDPDAPSRKDPRMKYWRHWVVSNIKAADIKAGNIQGNVITDYQPPTPPPTTGLHRYQFFVYLQGDRVISIPTKENRNRGAWKLQKFLQDHKLQNHETSTQFMTEHDGEWTSLDFRMNEVKGKFSER